MGADAQIGLGKAEHDTAWKFLGIRTQHKCKSTRLHLEFEGVDVGGLVDGPNGPVAASLLLFERES